jgi:hypothetical protein
MGFALRTNRLGLITNAGRECGEPLLWRLVALPVTHNLSQQRDECIGLLLVLLPVFLQRFLALVVQLLHASNQHIRQVVQGLRGSDTNQGHGECQLFQLLGGLHPGGVHGPRFIRKALQFGFRNPLQGLSCRIQGLQPPDMDEMLAEMFQRGLFGFPFELLPLTGDVMVVPAQQPGHREALRLIQRRKHLVIISVVHLGAGLLGSPPQRTECRQLIACFDQPPPPITEELRLTPARAVS